MQTATYNRLKGLMGLCVRARQAVFGEDGCLKTVRAGSCGVILVDEGASQATKEKYRGACLRAGVTVAWLPEGLLFDATGRPGVAMAVPKGGLAEQLKGLLSEENTASEEANHSGGASVE